MEKKNRELWEIGYLPQDNSEEEVGARSYYPVSYWVRSLDFIWVH